MLFRDNQMKVMKRNGNLVPVRFDEITDRIDSLAKDLDQNFIDPVKITKEVMEKINNGISTSMIDTFTAEICHSKTIEHPHFNVLAGRLIISDHHKNILIAANMKFSEVCKILQSNTDQLGNPSPLISKELYDLSQEYSEEINSMIDDERDFAIDFFGFKTLHKSYLLRVAGTVVETPQHMWMRVALGIWGRIRTEDGVVHPHNFDLVKETYDYLSTKYFTHATPTLFNAGTKRNQMLSCFLEGIDDNIESIFKLISDTAKISKWAGGVGLHISSIRANKSYIRGTGGNADGIVPMLKVFNDVARYINQGGKRAGSFAMYLEPWHSDIEDFLSCKLPHGDDNKRARDLFYALWIPDLFMERVKNNELWSLMCPSECPGLNNVYGNDFKKMYERYELEGKVRKTVKAQDLFNKIVSSQIETGTPYMCYKDAVNYKSNQKNIGVIKSSNLCVVPETRILVEDGWHEIASLIDKEVKVWNGEQWSPTTIRKTGENQKIIKVTLSNGSVLQCTEYHKFYVEDIKNTIVEAKDLVEGMKLIRHNLPIIREGSDMKYPYTQGLFSADGTICRPDYGPYEEEYKITLYGEKKELIPFLDIRTSSYKETANGTINVMLPYDMDTKFKVPINYSMDSKLRWLEGLCDGDGTVSNNSIQIVSIEKDFLVNTLFMLQTMGVHSKVTKNKDARKEFLPDGKGGQKEYNCKEIYRLLIAATETQKLLELGFNPKRLIIEKKEYNGGSLRYITIVSVENEERISDTYCFTEKLKNAGMFEGILTSQCSEIMEYSDTEKYACCVLSSIVLPTYVTNGVFDHDKLAEVVKVVTRNLNRIIDINYYPVKETKDSNMSERPLGIGIQGLADVFFKMGIAYDSPEALEVDRNIMETIYYSALNASMEISKKDGPYPSYKGSPISKGQFQFDLWKEFPTSKDVKQIDICHSGRHDWDKLKKNIKKHGVRNSLVTALMPTASTSQIMGSASESFEPITSNCYTRRTNAGEFIILNNYLANDLIKNGLWKGDMRNKFLESRGSVQNMEDIPQKIKDVYKTVWEIKQKVLIDHSIYRAVYVDQSQSLNLYFKVGSYDLITKAHFYAWSNGLKTGSYYIRTQSAVNGVSFTKKDAEETVDEPEDETCVVCSS